MLITLKAFKAVASRRIGLDRVVSFSVVKRSFFNVIRQVKNLTSLHDELCSKIVVLYYEKNSHHLMVLKDIRLRTKLDFLIFSRSESILPTRDSQEIKKLLV